jgi:DNA-binding beta-propeller fold protein YncE
VGLSHARAKEDQEFRIKEEKMKTYLTVLLTLCMAFVSRAQGQNIPMQSSSGLLKLVQTIPLPTEGYMDRLTVDVKGQRLFVCGENNKTLVVVDLRAGNVIHETRLAASPKKPVYLPDTNEVWVNMTDNTLVAISGATYEVTKVVPLTGHGDPNRGGDNGAYDPATHLYYAAVETFKDNALEAFKGGTDIAYGGADNHVPRGASIEIVDTKTAELVGSIKLPGGDPAGVAIETSGKRLYVTMGDVIGGDSHVAVVDLEKRVVVARWPITGGPVPHTAGLDAVHHRLLIGSRIKPNTGEFGGGHQYEPGKLVVMDTETGKVVQALDNVGGADDTIYYDAATGRIYCPGTTGTVAVFQEKDPDHFVLLGKVPTGAVSKTGLWVPEWKRFYSAVPQHFVLTAPHGSKDIRADLRKELNQREGTVQPILANLISEPAHLMVFDYLP